MKWAGHVARITQTGEMHTVFSCRNPRGRVHLED